MADDVVEVEAAPVAEEDEADSTSWLLEGQEAEMNDVRVTELKAMSKRPPYLIAFTRDRLIKLMQLLVAPDSLPFLGGARWKTFKDFYNKKPSGGLVGSYAVLYKHWLKEDQATR